MAFADLISWGAALLIAVAVSGGAMFTMAGLRDSRLRASRLTVGAAAASNADRLGGKLAGLVTGVASLGSHIAVRTPSQVSVLRAQLTQAGYFKREAKPSEREILIARVTDRPIRPFFPDGYRNDVQINNMLMVSDGENEPDVLSVCASSSTTPSA